MDGSRLTARVSRALATSECRVSLALAKTHVTSIVTLSLKNMLSSIHPADRVMMHGSNGSGNGYSGWKRLAVEFLKGDSMAVNALTRAHGLRQGASRNGLAGASRPDAWRSLGGKEEGSSARSRP